MRYNELMDVLFSAFSKVFDKWMKKNKQKESLIEIVQQLNLFAKKINSIASSLEEEYKQELRK